MVTFSDLNRGLRTLGIERNTPILAHASLSAFGEVRGGAESLLGAVMNLTDHLMMPAFTYQTMLIPEAGPAGNGLTYGSGRDLNRMAEFFSPSTPVDRMMGVLPEKLRCLSQAARSTHPILSFTGVGVADALAAQTLQEPLAPIGRLAWQGGWVLLLGVDHTVNTTIHYAEKEAGRKQFVRWALTTDGVQECPGFPGCSDGFGAIAPRVAAVTRTAMIENALIQAVPMKALIQAVIAALLEDPRALLCSRAECERCDAIRGLA